MIKSVEDSKLNTLPTVAAYGAAASAGSFDTSKYDMHQMHQANRETEQGRMAMQRALAVHRQKESVRSVAEQMQESKTLELLHRPDQKAGRELLVERYGLSAPPQPRAGSSSQLGQGRPVEKYGKSGRQAGRRITAKTCQNAGVVPKMYRQSAMFPPLKADAAQQQGVLNLINRGMLPAYADVSHTLATGEAAPLQSAQANFYSFHEQFSAAVTCNEPSGVARLHVRDGSETALQNITQQPVVKYGAAQPRPAEVAGLAMTSFEPSLPMTLSSPVSTAPNSRGHSRGANRADVREYDTMVASYGLHQLIFSKGKSLSGTPEYIAFKQKYSFMWKSVLGVITQVESLLKKAGIEHGCVSACTHILISKTSTTP